MLWIGSNYNLDVYEVILVKIDFCSNACFVNFKFPEVVW